jgi:hypothetical protein
MRKALRTSILILALSGSAYAGEMPCGAPTPPTAPAYGGDMPNDVAGNIPNGSPQDEQTAVDIITETALILLQNVLTVF